MITDTEALALIRHLQEEYEQSLHAFVVAGDTSPAKVTHAAWTAWQQTMAVLKEVQP